MKFMNVIDYQQLMLVKVINALITAFSTNTTQVIL